MGLTGAADAELIAPQRAEILAESIDDARLAVALPRLGVGGVARPNARVAPGKRAFRDFATAFAHRKRRYRDDASVSENTNGGRLFAPQSRLGILGQDALSQR